MPYKNEEDHKRRSKEYYYEHKNEPEYQDKNKSYQKKYKERNPEQLRLIKIRSRYKISIDKYEEMLSEQNGLCAICRKEETKKNAKHLCVDHDKKSNKVRGLLCHKCNVGIGCLNHDINLLLNSVKYLRRAV